MNPVKIIIKEKADLHQAAVRFINAFRGKRIFAFYGTMGAGKTTIIKKICESLGATDIVTSPTFTLVNEYRTLKGRPIYHIDFYRIRKKEEIFDFGIEEYFESGEYCFMEWPELIEDFLPEETVKVRLTVGNHGERILTVD
jgi:tRNA threonylcarbamoyladenosine biosynthesis protein TsaE